MDIQSITAQLNEIRVFADEADFECAHSHEASLAWEFIKYVASTSTDPKLAELAAVVLTSGEIEFSRYYA